MSTEPGGQGHVPAGSDEAREWHRIAEERRRQLERMQDRALYATAAAALGRGRRAIGLARRVVEPAVEVVGIIGRSAIALPSRARAGRRERDLRERLALLPPPADRAAQRHDVTAVIVTASQVDRLDALLGALSRIGVATIVVDNAGVPGIAQVAARYEHVRRIVLTSARSYSEANELAIAEVATAWTLLLNDDVAPLDDTWLDRMLAAADDRTVAVGAQLVHGRRGFLGGRAVDGTVQHAGVGFLLDGPLARPLHLGRGRPPMPVDGSREVPAATAACLLIRTDVHRLVGGFHPGFDYGSEDVDLCLRLAEHGAIRIALDAVLHHEEGATRLARGPGRSRTERARRQSANRRLLDARQGPLLRRQVVRAAFDAAYPADGYRVALRVVGPPARALTTALAGLPSVGLVTDGGGAMTIVTDPRRVPGGGHGVPAPDVPVIGWLQTGVTASGWTTDVLRRLDAVVIEGDAAPDLEAQPGDVLPVVHRVRTADEVREVVSGLLLAERWSVRIGARSGRRSERWGDTPVGDEIVDELRRVGIVARPVTRDRWGSEVDRAADVTLHLKGRGVAPTADAQRNVVWVMSHPSEVAPGELDAADLVVAGSAMLAARYRSLTSTRVEVLPQAAARRFVTAIPDPTLACRVLFVGNTRSVPRPAVLGAIGAGLPLTLVGGGWERYVDPRTVRADHVPYVDLPSWYASAEVVLNDHWEDMARWGLVSNRVFDALAAGACVVSDELAGMEDLFGGAVVTFRDRADVGAAVRRLLEDPAERAERVGRGRREVGERHTWQHRVTALVGMVGSSPAADGAR